jgi:hypothetical protein
MKVMRHEEIMKFTGHFILFPVITKIYNKKTKGPTLMELFTATGKLKTGIIASVKNIYSPMLTRVWQELEYRIDVCRVNHGAHIEYL